jgi:hypothetical protein
MYYIHIGVRACVHRVCFSQEQLNDSPVCMHHAQSNASQSPLAAATASPGPG